MFDNLTKRLDGALQRLRGTGKITESNIEATLREIRVALLEADVTLSVVKTIIEDIKSHALGEKVLRSLTPGQELIKIVNDVLTNIMGARNDDLDLTAQPPAVILMAGL